MTGWGRDFYAKSKRLKLLTAKDTKSAEKIFLGKKKRADTN
jgi:hypothetical protein